MHQTTTRKLTAILMSTLLLLSTTQALAQCNWSTRVVLPETAAGQPGIVSFTGADAIPRLFLTWGGFGNDYLNSLISTDGVNWTNKLTMSQFPLVAPYDGGGVSMTASAACGSVYVGWRDINNNMWGASSGLGTFWNGAFSINPSGIQGLSAPALRGDDSTLPIGLALSVLSPDPAAPAPYEASKGKFNCDFSFPTLIPDPCFFNAAFCGFFWRQYGAWTPVWTGANGTTELRAIATGPNDACCRVAEIIYQVNSNDIQVAGPNWSNNGLAGAVNPADGTPYIAWTCHNIGGGTCGHDGISNRINILNVNTGALQQCGDWSPYNPALTFFQGQLWVAWQGGGTNPSLGVASLTPF